MVESSISLQSLIQDLDIPQDFKSRFIRNYQNQEIWMDSTIIYDEWFNQYYTRYQQFTAGIEYELLLDVDYKQTTQCNVINGRGNRKRYLVSFDGLKQLEMKCDRNTRKYYIQLEKCVQQHIQLTLQNQQEQIIQLTIQYNECKKTGFIYGFKHKLYNTIDYIGYTTTNINRRRSQHIQALQKDLKIPFYKIVMCQVMQQYEVVQIEEIQFVLDREILAREKYWQTHFNSIQSQDNLVCKKCERKFKNILPFTKHRYNCFMDQDIDIGSETDSD